MKTVLAVLAVLLFSSCQKELGCYDCKPPMTLHLKPLPLTNTEGGYTLQITSSDTFPKDVVLYINFRMEYQGPNESTALMFGYDKGWKKCKYATHLPLAKILNIHLSYIDGYSLPVNFTYQTDFD